jgi:hypothetical protein
MEAYAFRQAQEGVRVALDPFFTVERTRGTFSGGEEFPEKGLLPVQVIIENGGASEIQMSPRNFRLVRPTGKTEAALSPYDAFAMVKLPVGLWALGTGVIGGSIPAYRNDARLRDIESRELREAAIPPGGSATGFIYFAIQEGESDLAGSRIFFSVKGTGGWDLNYDLAIAGRRDIPAVPRTVETPAPPSPSGSSPQGATRTEGIGGQGVIIRSPGP